MTTRTAAARQHLERLLRVATCLAQCGYGAQVGQLAATARAFRGDAQLWTAQARNRGPAGRTLLMHAAFTGNVPRIQFLLERGADVEATSELGTTALMMACRQERRYYEPLAARVLVERGGANVNSARSSDGVTALMYAVHKGHLEIVRFLVELGSTTVNAGRFGDGFTALLWASQEGHLEIARFLVERGGANIFAARTTDGVTALMLASLEGHLEIARFLVERGGANVNNATTDHDMTALLFASLKGHHEVVRSLLQHGADKHALSHDGSSAFSLAASFPLVLAALA